MSNLSSIRTMQELEHQRATLRMKSMQEELQLRQDFAEIKSGYTTVAGVISGIRSNVSRFKVLGAVVWPIARWLISRRKNRK